MAFSKQLLTQAVEAALEQIKAELIASVVESLLAVDTPVANGKVPKPAPKATASKSKAPAKIASKPAPKVKPAPAKKSPTKKKLADETLVEKMQRVLGNQAAQKKAAKPPGAFYNINSGKCLVVSAVSKRTKVFFTATKDEEVLQFAGNKVEGKKKNVELEAAKKNLGEEGWIVQAFVMEEPEKAAKKKGDEAKPKKSPAKKSDLKPLIQLNLEEKDGLAVADGYVWTIETEPQAVIGKYDESVKNPNKRCVKLTEEDLEDCKSKGYEVIMEDDNSSRKQDAKASGVLLKKDNSVTKAPKVDKIRTEAAK